MAGHSKWANIKHRKAAQDAKKGKINTKHSKIIMIVGRNDPNPETNASLRAAIKNAKADGVPNDNIDRIIKKLSGVGKESTQYVEQVYEGFGPEGIPFMITALTDNIKRTFPEVRQVFNKKGGNLGTSGSVSFLFNHVGVIIINSEGKTEDDIFELVMNAGGDEFEYEFEDGKTEITTKFTDLGAVRDELEKLGAEIIKFEPQYRAKDPQTITDEKALEKLATFEDALSEVDDVDEVFGGYQSE